MFKTFHQYLQTRDGHTAPLDSPVSSCCLLPLMTLFAMPEGIAIGGVIIAIATTGLGVMLVVRMANPQRKDLNSTHQIPQLIMFDRTLLGENLENLEKLLFLSLSNSEERENFYREIAINRNITVNEVKVEVCFNELKITNFIRSQGKLHLEEENAIKKLKLRWTYWLELNEIASKTFPLISPSINNYLKEYVQVFITSFNQANESGLFNTYFYYLIKNSSSKNNQEALEHCFLIEQTLLNCYQFSNCIDNQKDVSQYIWNDYTIEEEAELLEQFITLYKKDVERDSTLKENYENSIESLERLLSDLKSIASRKQESIHNQKQEKISLEEQLVKFLNIDSEELIKRKEQFKPLVPVKDDYTSEKIDYSPDAIKERLIAKYNSKPRKQGLSWEEESELLRIMIKDVEEDLQKEYTPEELAVIERIQKRLENE